MNILGLVFFFSFLLTFDVGKMFFLFFYSLTRWGWG
jgi:hypothetical protein